MTERGTMPPNMNGLAKFAFVGILLAMLVALPPSPAAQAHDPNDIWGWRGCSFRSNEANNQAVVVRNDGSFPGSIQNPPGVTNSFRDRMVDASDRWTVQMQLNGITSTVRFFDGIGSNDIIIRYRDVGGLLGRTGRTALGGAALNCPVHGNGDVDIYQSIVDVDPRNEWFTQDDSRRAGWEGCTLDAYTCSRIWDFGGVLTHEIGHALGIAHAEEADVHLGGGTRAADDARCGDGRNYATMCANYIQRTSAWRTLDVWDIETLRRLYANN